MLYNRVLKITKVDPVAFYNLRTTTIFGIYGWIKVSRYITLSCSPFFFQRDLGREGDALWKWTS